MDGNDRQYFHSGIYEDEQDFNENQSKNSFSNLNQDQINENPQKIFGLNENFSSENNNINTVDKISNFKGGWGQMFNNNCFEIHSDCFQYNNNYIPNNNYFFNEDYLTNNEKEINNIEVNRKKDIITDPGKSNASIAKFIVQDTKPINSCNLTLTKTFKKIFDEDIDKFEVKDGMKLTKRKRIRRTKKQIEMSSKDTQNLKQSSLEKKNQAKFGRRPKNNQEETITNFKNKHDYKSDDNIIKKINTHFLESIRIWLNSSFIDSNGEFKKRKDYFLKINPKLVATNLNRDFMLNLFNKKIEEIFSNDVSTKYDKRKKNNNKDLIKKINNEKNQPYISYILNLTFYNALQIFCGNEKINEKYKIIDQNFPKIGEFLDKITKIERKNKNSEQNVKDYVHRISMLCLNYKKWFEIKYSRKKKEDMDTEKELENK